MYITSFWNWQSHRNHLGMNISSTISCDSIEMIGICSKWFNSYSTGICSSWSENGYDGGVVSPGRLLLFDCHSNWLCQMLRLKAFKFHDSVELPENYRWHTINILIYSIFDDIVAKQMCCCKYCIRIKRLIFGHNIFAHSHLISKHTNQILKSS